MDFAGPGTPLNSDDVDANATLIQVGLPELWSVISVETSGCGFLPDRRPKILFERHFFHRLTGGKFDAEDPDVSAPNAGGYGPSGAHQYDRLAAAIQLDRHAALQSASWGLGQIMGSNFQAAGYNDVEHMVADMVASEANQLRAMANFIKANGMDDPLRAHDWASVARRYNGPNYAANNYDGQLAHFFQLYAGGSATDFRVRAAQIYLFFLGYDTGGIDGKSGPATARAVTSFQKSAGLAETGVVDDALLNALANTQPQSAQDITT